MNTERNIQQSTAFHKEQWILHSGIPGDKWFSSIVGLNEDFLTNPPELEELEKVIKIFEQRERIKQHSLVTAVIGEEDFLPLSFLQQGAKKGAAVCRIARYFSKSSFKEFIEEVQEAITKWGTAENFNTPAKLKEIFLLPDSVAQKIFSPPNPEGDNALLDKPEEDAGKLLDKLKALNESQLAKINPIPIGTGFLVGGTHLLTNHHVLPSAKVAEECVAQFHYEDDEDSPEASIDYEFDPKTLFVSEPSLDYTLVQLKSGVFTRQAGYRMGWIQLIEDDVAICPGLSYLQFENYSKDYKKDFWAELSSNVATTLFSSSSEANESPSSTNLLANVPQDLINKLLPFQNVGLWSDRLSQLEQDRFFPKPVFFLDVQTEEQRQAFQGLRDWKGPINNLTPYFSLQGAESGDLVFIIQHPKGRRKEISIGNNKVIDYGLFKDFLRYGADTDYGSSGSPVFNAQWQLVALNHAAIPKIVSDTADHYGEGKGKPPEIIASQGVRIFSIVGDLKKKSVRYPKLKSFIQDFVITAEQLNSPPLPAVARLNEGVGSKQKNGYFDCGNHESLDVSEAVTVEAWVAKFDDESGHIFRRGNDLKENAYWICWFKQQILVEVRSENKHYSVNAGKPRHQDGLWHHVAFTWSKSQEIQVYIDGKRQETQLAKGTPLESPIGKINEHVWIGNGDYGWDRLGGVIAEVRLWKTVRSQAQIEETMYRRLAGDHRKEGLIGCWQFEKDRASKNYVYNLASPDGGSKVLPIEPFTHSPKIKIAPQFGLEFNGDTDYIDCGSVEIKNDITFEAWVKKPRGKDEPSFIAGQGGCWEGLGYSLWWHEKENKISMELGGDQINQETYAPRPDDDDWHHIAFTWSRGSHICIYIDGKISQNHNKKPEPFAGPIGSPAVNFCIGRNKTISAHRFFQGKIAEVRLWTVARSEEQINDAMNRQLRNDEIQDTNLVGYWRLDEQTGNEAANLAGKGQPGVVYGGTWLQPQYVVQDSRGDFGVALGVVKWLKASECPASLPLPCGLRFNGKDDRVNCGQDPSLNATDAITVEAWVKHRFGNCLIVSRGGDVDDGYSLCWHDGKIRVMLKSPNQVAIVDTKENAPVDQVWHHVAFTWDKTSQEILIYVDGRQQDCVVMGQAKAFAYAGQTKSTGLFTGSLADLKTDLVIGCKTGKEQYYDVAIAEVRLWKVARTQDQIKTNMTCRLSRRDDDWPDLLAYWRLDDGGADNNQARNLVSDSNHGVIQDAQWFPAPPSSVNLSPSPTSTENPSISTPSV